MDMSMLDVISDAAFNTCFKLARVPIKRERDGSITGNSPDDLKWYGLNGVVQSAKGKDTKHLQQGDQTKPGIKVWCARALNPTWGDLPQLGDLIEWHGRTYRVAEPADWSEYGFWKAIALEVRQDE